MNQQVKPFDVLNFQAAFALAIEALKASENVTKEKLKELSRTVLEATHATGDVRYINEILIALTPVNRKVAVHFFRYFSGMHYDDVLARFTGKSKKRYLKSLASSLEFLADPHNNIWTWAERNIHVEPKPFDVDALNKRIAGVVKAATDANMGHSVILRGLLKAGFTADDMLAILESDCGLEITKGEEQPTKGEEQPA